MINKLLNVLLTSIVILTLVIIADEGIKEVAQYKELKQIKSNIENMLESNGNMETVKEGRKNIAAIKGDQIVITQNVDVYDYEIILDKNHKNVTNNILLYMTGYNSFNTDLNDIEINFN